MACCACVQRVVGADTRKRSMLRLCAMLAKGLCVRAGLETGRWRAKPSARLRPAHLRLDEAAGSELLCCIDLGCWSRRAAPWASNALSPICMPRRACAAECDHPRLTRDAPPADSASFAGAPAAQCAHPRLTRDASATDSVSFADAPGAECDHPRLTRDASATDSA
eukprot:2464097-Prymnesium_polylepis.1